MLLEALVKADLPKGVLNVVTGLGGVVGAELVRNPDVAKISFTGSVAVGQGIMRDGAATMKRVTLELGGKSPNILLDDANFDQAIPLALGIAFMNSGQACAAGTRLLVPSHRLEEAKRAIVAAMRDFPWRPCRSKDSCWADGDAEAIRPRPILHPQRHRRRRRSAGRRRRSPGGARRWLLREDRQCS